jgi:ribosomal protein S18 acetylase RimI-like enzyme
VLDASQVFMAHVDSWQAQGRLREPYGGGTAEFAGWKLMASGLGYSYLNAACMTDPALADIDEAREWYRSRNLPWGTLVPAGSAWPHGQLLLTLRLMAVKAAAFSKAAVPSGCVLHQAGRGDIEVVAAIDAGAFGSGVAEGRSWLEPLCVSDGARVAIGELDGLPVATGYALRCDGDAGLSVYLGGIAVLPATRQRGVAAALSSWLLAPGFEAGARFAHLQTDSNGAARVYERLGFEEFSGIDIYDGQ